MSSLRSIHQFLRSTCAFGLVISSIGTGEVLMTPNLVLLALTGPSSDEFPLKSVNGVRL